MVYIKRKIKKKRKRRIIAKRGVFCRLNYKIRLGNSSFSFMWFWWLVCTNSKAGRRRILGPHVRRVSHRMTVLVRSVTWICSLFRQQSRFRVTSLASKGKRRVVSLKNARTCTADEQRAARYRLFFSQHGARKSKSVNDFQYESLKMHFSVMLRTIDFRSGFYSFAGNTVRIFLNPSAGCKTNNKV